VQRTSHYILLRRGARARRPALASQTLNISVRPGVSRRLPYCGGATERICVPARARAQDPVPQTEPARLNSHPLPGALDSNAAPNEPAASEPDAKQGSELATRPVDDSKNRIFFVLPNYTTIEGTGHVPAITTAQSFKMAALDSFDPFVYPLFGFIAGVSQLQDSPPSWPQDFSGYAKRFGLAFADNTLCSLFTTGVMPSVLKQDPRYYQGRTTGFLPRVGYAASRTLVTRSRSGHHQFNLSEIGGTFLVATVSNAYYPAEERNRTDTLNRWWTQAMWDTLSNELKEFWPDIRRPLRRSS